MPGENLLRGPFQTGKHLQSSRRKGMSMSSLQEGPLANWKTCLRRCWPRATLRCAASKKSVAPGARASWHPRTSFTSERYQLQSPLPNYTRWSVCLTLHHWCGQQHFTEIYVNLRLQESHLWSIGPLASVSSSPRRFCRLKPWLPQWLCPSPSRKPSLSWRR